jgi:hypothetical protein
MTFKHLLNFFFLLPYLIMLTTPTKYIHFPCRTHIDVGPTLIITLNYVIFSNYYQYRRVSIRVKLLLDITGITTLSSEEISVEKTEMKHDVSAEKIKGFANYSPHYSPTF